MSPEQKAEAQAERKQLDRYLRGHYIPTHPNDPRVGRASDGTLYAVGTNRGARRVVVTEAGVAGVRKVGKAARKRQKRALVAARNVR